RRSACSAVTQPSTVIALASPMLNSITTPKMANPVALASIAGPPTWDSEDSTAVAATPTTRHRPRSAYTACRYPVNAKNPYSGLRTTSTAMSPMRTTKYTVIRPRRDSHCGCSVTIHSIHAAANPATANVPGSGGPGSTGATTHASTVETASAAYGTYRMIPSSRRSHASSSILHLLPAEQPRRRQPTYHHVRRQYRHLPGMRPGAAGRVAQRLLARAERGEVADAAQDCGHRLPGYPEAGEEHHGEEQHGTDGVAGLAARSEGGDHQTDREQRRRRQRKRASEARPRYRYREKATGHGQHQPDRDECHEQVGDQLGGEQLARRHRRGRHPPQDALLPVVREHGRGELQRQHRQHERDGDGRVQVHDPQPPDTLLRIAEPGHVAEDADEQRRERDREEHHQRFAQEQAELGAEQGVHAWSPRVRARNASSRLACSTRRSAAMIWWRASTEVTACSTFPVPVTTTWSPRRPTPVTSGRSASSLSGSGAEGRNRIRCSVLTRATRPAGVSQATIRPRSMTASRSHSRSASSMKWVTSTTVTPRPRMSSMSCQVSRRA